MKRVLSFILIISLLCTLFSSFAAAESPVRYQDALFTLSGGTVALRVDGSVVCAGLPADVSYALRRWRGITQICADGDILCGLRADGFVEALYLGDSAGMPSNVQEKIDVILS